MIGKNSRYAGAATVAMGLALAGVCLAQAPDPTNAAAVKAWQTSNNITDKTGALGWQAFTAQPDGVYFRGVIDPRDPTTNQASVGVRIEHFAPVASPGGPVLSEVATFAVDCTAPNGGRIKQVKNSFYPQHNLGGATKDVAVTDDWAPTSTIDFLVAEVQAACRAVAGGARVAAAGAGAGAGGRMPPPFNVNDAAAGRRWMLSEKIDQGGSASTPDWPLLGYQNDGAMFRSANPDTQNSVSRLTPRYLLREEFYGPITLPGGGTALSQSIDYDINCGRNQVRRVRISSFPSRNLAGTAVVTNLTGDFIPVAQDPVIKEAFDEICQAADKAVDQGAGKFLH